MSNPRVVTDEIAMELYKKSNLPEKSYFKAMAGLCVRGHINTAKKIFEEKINKENINLAISEFKDFVTPEGKEFKLLSGYCKEIYDLLVRYSKEK